MLPCNQLFIQSTGTELLAINLDHPTQSKCICGCRSFALVALKNHANFTSHKYVRSDTTTLSTDKFSANGNIWPPLSAGLNCIFIGLADFARIKCESKPCESAIAITTLTSTTTLTGDLVNKTDNTHY